MSCQLMSPYAWRQRGEAGLSLLVRAVSVAHATTGQGISGRIWYGTDQGDGLTFAMDEAPLIEPGPGALDIGGCEDPTVVPTSDDCVVYYTGLDATGAAQLLYARGPDIRRLAKRGVAHASTATEGNTKEAAVECMNDDEWRLLFEYSRDVRSRVGLAIGGGPAGPWEEQPDPFEARPDKWDCWHLSTGPLLMDEADGPVMLYNGSDKDAAWGIGWVVLDRDCLRAVARCDLPLIGPPADTDGDGHRISFAASALCRDDGAIWLYLSQDDRTLFRATLRRC